MERGRDRAGDLHLGGHGRGEEGETVAGRGVGERGGLRGGLAHEGTFRRRQIEARPLRAREWPFVLRPQGKLLAGAAEVQRYPRLAVPAGVLALEKVPEEAALQVRAVARIEMREMRVAVHLEPFLLGACCQITFEIAARMQPLAAPVRCRQDWHVDRGEI